MSRFKFTKGNKFTSELNQVPKRTPEEMAERKRKAVMRRDEKRQIMKKKNQDGGT